MDSSTHTAFIAFGANQGNREANIRSALSKLEDQGVHLEAVSSLLETEPVGGPEGQGMFLNGAARVRTAFDALKLLDILLKIESELGRVRDPEVRSGPRSIDLDLLLYGHQILDIPGLTLPHPRMHERLFVLQPLAEVGAEIQHPIFGLTVAELLQAIRSHAIDT